MHSIKEFLYIAKGRNNSLNPYYQFTKSWTNSHKVVLQNDPNFLKIFIVSNNRAFK